MIPCHMKKTRANALKKPPESGLFGTLFFVFLVLGLID